jgi:pimeloyl-ACP methyl ester carboxylesterase
MMLLAWSKPLKLGQINIAGHAFGNRVARTLAADHPELVHSVILFAAGGKVPPKPPGEHALQTIFNPASTDAEVLNEMKYMVGNPAEIPMAWQIIKPCRAPQVAGLQRTAMENTPLKDWWAPPGQMKYLVLQGTDDQIAPQKMENYWRKSWDNDSQWFHFRAPAICWLWQSLWKPLPPLISFLQSVSDPISMRMLIRILTLAAEAVWEFCRDILYL